MEGANFGVYSDITKVDGRECLRDGIKESLNLP
jgi:hypothetical protein